MGAVTIEVGVEQLLLVGGKGAAVEPLSRVQLIDVGARTPMLRLTR
jgi:hypothetical protein